MANILRGHRPSCGRRPLRTTLTASWPASSENAGHGRRKWTEPSVFWLYVGCWQCILWFFEYVVTKPFVFRILFLLALIWLLVQSPSLSLFALSISLRQLAVLLDPKNSWYKQATSKIPKTDTSHNYPTQTQTHNLNQRNTINRL
jgi:hypothetical protein